MPKITEGLIVCGQCEAIGYNVHLCLYPFDSGDCGFVLLFDDPSGAVPPFLIPHPTVEGWLQARAAKRSVPASVYFIGVLWPSGVTAPMVLGHEKLSMLVDVLAATLPAAYERYTRLALHCAGSSDRTH